MHKFVIFECTLLHLSHPLTTTCFVLWHSHLWELYEEASRDRLVYGLFLLIHNWHASMKMVVESIIFFGGCDHTGEAIPGADPDIEEGGGHT